MANTPKAYDVVSEIRLILFLKTLFSVFLAVFFFLVPFMTELGNSERPHAENQIKNHAIFTKKHRVF